MSKYLLYYYCTAQFVVYRYTPVVSFNHFQRTLLTKMDLMMPFFTFMKNLRNTLLYAIPPKLVQCITQNFELIYYSNLVFKNHIYTVI